MFYFNDTLTPFIQKHQIISSNQQIQTIITGANIELLTEEMAENEIFSVQEGKIIIS